MRIKKVEKEVKSVLELNPIARDDDFILINEVYKKFTNISKYYSFNDVMENHKEYKLPSFESITRARRKLQAENPHLRATKKVEDLRLENEVKMYNYAINIYK